MAVTVEVGHTASFPVNVPSTHVLEPPSRRSQESNLR